MTVDGFEATFRLRLAPTQAWDRLVGDAEDVGELVGTQVWLPGFDAKTTIVEADAPRQLRATKDDQPCAGTDIVVTLSDAETGTMIHVVQSRFGDWLDPAREMMAIGWRYIVADLQLFLATGLHAGRHLRPWADLGANFTAADGGVRVRDVVPGALADTLGLQEGDLLVDLGGAPVASCDDLETVLRATANTPASATFVREGALISTAG